MKNGLALLLTCLASAWSAPVSAQAAAQAAAPAAQAAGPAAPTAAVAAAPVASPTSREASAKPKTAAMPVTVASASTTTNSAGAAAAAGEPGVRHTVIDSDSASIDELSVRGVPQHIVVTPKGRVGATYEIITGDGSRDLSDGANTSRGAAGKRVWRVLNF